MAKKPMLDTKFLFQPRGQKTAYLFRMATPPILLGRKNPRTGKPYGNEIRESLGRTRDLRKAREERDLRLGDIRREQERAIAHANGSMEDALEIAASLSTIEDDETLEAAKSVLGDRAEALEAQIGKRLEAKLGPEQAKAVAEQKAVRWYKAASGERTPFKAACDQYKDDGGKSLSKSSINNLETAVKEFLAFAGEDVSLQEIDRRKVAEFVTNFLPNRKGPKAPSGQGPATIRKKVSQLAQVWRWAQKRGLLPYSKETPWDDQAPSKRDIAKAKMNRDDFAPEETRELLAKLPAGTALGDMFRVALMTGVRLEEVASLDASQVQPEGRWYTILHGKTPNAQRVVPLVGMAREVVQARLAKVKSTGPLFPEEKVRKSTGKRGGSVSQKFTRLRRDVLGTETDGRLTLHSLRHTWATIARRAGIDARTTDELGGWKLSRVNARSGYEHGLEFEQYEREQLKVAQWLTEKGYVR
jgi:integrase